MGQLHTTVALPVAYISALWVSKQGQVVEQPEGSHRHARPESSAGKLSSVQLGSVGIAEPEIPSTSASALNAPSKPCTEMSLPLVGVGTHGNEIRTTDHRLVFTHLFLCCLHACVHLNHKAPTDAERACCHMTANESYILIWLTCSSGIFAFPTFVGLVSAGRKTDCQGETRTWWTRASSCPSSISP